MLIVIQGKSLKYFQVYANYFLFLWVIENIKDCEIEISGYIYF